MLELRVEGGRVRPSYIQGRYGVVPPKAPDIVAIIARLIRLQYHTIGRRHPRRLPPNATSVEEQSDDHCESDPCRCVQSLQMTFRSAHHLIQPLAMDGRGAGTSDESSPSTWIECAVELSLCSTEFSLMVSEFVI